LPNYETQKKIICIKIQSGFFFSFQFGEVGELVISHKKKISKIWLQVREEKLKKKKKKFGTYFGDMLWSKYDGFNFVFPSKYGDFGPSLNKCPLYELQSLYFCCKA
jgi:hypothetical protein